MIDAKDFFLSKLGGDLIQMHKMFEVGVSEALKTDWSQLIPEIPYTMYK